MASDPDSNTNMGLVCDVAPADGLSDNTQPSGKQHTPVVKVLGEGHGGKCQTSKMPDDPQTLPSTGLFVICRNLGLLFLS